MWVVGAATTTRSTRPLRSISCATLRPKVVLPAAGVAEARKLPVWWAASAWRAAACHARSGRSAGKGGSDAPARRAATPVLTRGSPFFGWLGRRREAGRVVRGRGRVGARVVGTGAGGGRPRGAGRSRGGAPPRRRRPLAPGRPAAGSALRLRQLPARPRPDRAPVEARRLPRVRRDAPARAEAAHHLEVRSPADEGVEVGGGAPHGHRSAAPPDGLGPEPQAD